MRILNITLMAAVLAMASCNEEYDPIGPNKPSPVLIVSPLELAYDGTGGSLTSKISTNAESVTIGELPDWVESASVNEDNTSVTVTVKPNEDSYAVKRGTLKLVSSSGDNTVTQYMKLYQAGKDSKMSFASFRGNLSRQGGSSMTETWFRSGTVIFHSRLKAIRAISTPVTRSTTLPAESFISLWTSR